MFGITFQRVYVCFAAQENPEIYVVNPIYRY